MSAHAFTPNEPRPTELEQLSAGVAHVRTELVDRLHAGQIESLQQLHASEIRLIDRIDALDARLTARIDAVEAKLTARIDAVEARLDAIKFQQVWMFAVLLAVIVATNRDALGLWLQLLHLH